MASHATTVLAYVNTKLNLLDQHVLTVSSKYDHWDLRINLSIDTWTVEVEGYLYSPHFHQINEQGARGREGYMERYASVVSETEFRPTVSICPREMAHLFHLSHERATHIVDMACKFQEDTNARNPFMKRRR